MKKIILSSLILGMMLATAGVVVAGKVETKVKNADQCTTIQSGDLVASDGSAITTGFDDWGYNYQGRLFNGLYCDSYRDAAWCQEYKDVKLSMKWNDAWLSNKDCDGWELFGDWVLDFDYNGGSHVHDMKITDNSFIGTGVAQSYPYQTWTVDGIVNGDEVEMKIIYDGLSYYVDMVGTIASDGTMSGTWSNAGQSGTWESTSGAAVKLLDRHYGYDSYIGSGAWLTNHQSGEYELDGETCKWNYFVKIVAAPSDATLTDGVWYSADGIEIGPAIWGAFAIIQQVENDECAGLNGMQYVSPAGAGLGQYKEKVTFIHYADGRHEQIGGPKLTKKAKPVKDDVCYSFIARDMEWKVQPEYVINPTNTEGLTDDFVVATVNKATAEWDNYGFDIFGDYNGIDYTVGFTGDEVNSVSFGDYDKEGVIAVCSVWGYYRGPPANRQITEFDVMFDTDFDWADCTAVGADCILEKKMDFQNIATHELGHAVGLGDLYNPECSDETMYGYGSYGGIHARSLYYGDIAGLNILYGN